MAGSPELEEQRMHLDDYVDFVADAMTTLWMVRRDILRFVKAAKAMSNEIVEKLRNVPATEHNGSVAFLDPTKRFFGLMQIECLSTAREVYLIRMVPPFLPHFFLVLAYASTRFNLTPILVARCVPVMTLVAVCGPLKSFAAAGANIAIGIKLTPSYLEGSVSIIPPDPAFLKLPVETDRLYLTTLGYATVPLEKKAGVSIEMDLGSIPPISERVLQSLNMETLAEVLDRVLGR